jgi:hypothetical protein
MTDLQRRGRRGLLILLTFLGVIFLPGPAWGVWQARHDWRQFGPALGVLVWALTVGAGLWRGDGRARWAALTALGVVGALLIFLGVTRGQDGVSPEALGVYGRLGLHPMAVIFGAGAVCLIGAAALAFSAPIRAYWECRCSPGPKAASITLPGGGPQQQMSKAIVVAVISTDLSRPPSDGCLACGAPMPEEVARCASCGWTYSASEVAEQIGPADRPRE